MNVRVVTIAERRWDFGQTLRFDIPHAHAASFAVLFVEAALIVFLAVVAGVLFELAARSTSGDIAKFAATGVVVAILFAGLTRLQVRSFLAAGTRLHRARSGALAWLGTFAAVVALAFALKISADFSRGAIFTFFLSGLVVVPLAHAIAPRLMSQWLAEYPSLLAPSCSTIRSRPFAASAHWPQPASYWIATKTSSGIEVLAKYS
jgi:hypothetical protein